MLLRKYHHRPVKNPDVVQTAFFRGFAFVVNNGGIGKIIIFETAFHDAVRKVNVFAVHEKIFVEQADFSQNRPSKEHKRADQNVNFVRFVFAQMPQIILIEN